MKIHYKMTSKEYIHYLNVAQGVYLDRKKLKRKPNKRIRTLSNKIITNYLCILALIPAISFFDSFLNGEIISDILTILLLLIVSINTLLGLLAIIPFLKNRSKLIQGEIFFTQDGFTDISENNQEITKKWSELNLILVTQEVILLFTKRFLFLIPNEKDNWEKLSQITKEIPTIDKTNNTESFIQKHFENWGKYLFLFLLTLCLDLSWNIYNINVIDQEVWKINNQTEMDSHIYALEKFGVVESTLKDYFYEVRNNKEIYQANSALGTYGLLTLDFLKNHKEELPNILKELPTREKKSTEAIQNMLKLLSEETVKEKIQAKGLSNYYNELFLDYILTSENQIHFQHWQEELIKNSEKMGYVKRILEILTSKDSCWYVEEENLYMCNESQRLEYNNLRTKILDSQSSTSTV